MRQNDTTLLVFVVLTSASSNVTQSYFTKLREMGHLRAYGRRNVVFSALASINVVNRHWARLLLGWVTVCGWVNHLGM